MLHSGHIAFFEEAAKLGELYVGIGSDKTIKDLKGRRTINTEQERLYMVNALKSVKEAWVNSGVGVLDFKEDISRLKPDILYVNEDGHSSVKEGLCEELGIQYIVGKRIPRKGLPVRSTTALRTECRIPYRIDLAGGWLDQPEVSKYFSGAVITICIEPDYEFNDRSGMSTSTRKKAIELWQTDVPEGSGEHLAKILFSYENFPGEEYISGSQDALGIVLPGLNRLCYEGDFWPSQIQKNTSEEILKWIENRIFLVALSPRSSSLKVTKGVSINRIKAKKLSEESQKLWEAVLKKDAKCFGKAMTASFYAQTAMYPNMMTDEVKKAIELLPSDVLGYKLSGAGGGGYLVVFSEKPVEKALKTRIRRG